MSKNEQFPVFVGKNLTKMQERAFKIACKILQSNLTKYNFPTSKFEDFGTFGTIKQGDDILTTYVTNSNEVYHNLCLNPIALKRTMSQIFNKPKIFTDIAKAAQEFEQVELGWIKNDKEVIDVKNIPFMSLQKPTFHTIKVFTDAVLNQLDKKGVFDLLAIENGEMIDYYLQFNEDDVSKLNFCADSIISEKQFAIYAGSSALEKINQQDKLICYDEVGKKTTKARKDFEEYRNNKRAEEIKDTKEFGKQINDNYIDILTQIEIPQGYRPIFLKQIKSSKEPYSLYKQINNFLTLHRIKLDNDMDIKMENVTIDDIEYCVALVKGVYTQQYLITRSPMLNKNLQKENSLLKRSYPLYKIDLSGDCYLASTNPICSFSAKSTNKKVRESALDNLNKNINASSYAISSRADKNKTTYFLQYSPEMTNFSGKTYAYFVQEKARLIKNLENDNFKFKILDDNGMVAKQYHTSKYKASPLTEQEMPTLNFDK